MQQETVKFLDLKAQYPLIKDEIMGRFADIIDRTAFVSGTYVQSFEEDFARYCETEHAVAVSNGTNALYVALMALGVSHGDEVIVPANTFIATAEAVSLIGATPVFVDAVEATALIDVTKIEAAITPNTKAIIPVHLYGQCADMDPILAIAKQHGLFVIEDACQAHGARYKGKRAGSMGDCAAFSFYPGKNLGAWGEGGAVTTAQPVLAEKMKYLRDHGSRVKYHHEVIGGNFRMNEMQGAVLGVKLKHLESWNEGRRARAEQYTTALAEMKDISCMQTAEGNIPVWHLFVIRSEKRDALLACLRERDIQVGMHYPTPLHLTQAYEALPYSKGDFPIAEKIQSEIMSLPMYAELPETGVQRVVDTIKAFYAQSV